MAKIIDLKNKQPQAPALPEEQELPVEAEETQSLAEGRVINWSGRLHDPDLKSILIFAFLMFAIAALVQIFEKNIITTVFFALLGVVILLNAKRKSEIDEFEINSACIKANDKVFLYQNIRSFWIEYDPALGIKELSLQLKKWHAPYVKIPIYGQNPVQLRFALLEFLPEVEHKDSMVEILSRKLGI